ncbi:MAG: hypothetical protein PHD48_02815 [Alphaproteobacteria bacterium]|nr:hypothetical protein [Alphaproteobacteria bacterium]
MNIISTIGLDLAKNIFQVHGIDDSFIFYKERADSISSCRRNPPRIQFENSCFFASSQL